MSWLQNHIYIYVVIYWCRYRCGCICRHRPIHQRSSRDFVVFFFSCIIRIILCVSFWDFSSGLWGVIYKPYIPTVVWYSSMNLIYCCMITFTVECSIFPSSPRSFLLPLWSHPSLDFQAEATIDLLSMRLNNISWKLFYGNGKNGINSRGSAKYNLWHVPHIYKSFHSTLEMELQNRFV